MNDKQLRIVRHSLGLDHEGLGNMYRNHYCDSPGDPEMEALVELGMMERGQKINEGKSQFYHVTTAGKAAAIGKPKKVSKSKRRYQAFLSYDGGITFHEFLTHPAFAQLRRNC